MRISDWSSDVCSSDLARALAAIQCPQRLRQGSTTDLRHPRVVRQPGLRHRERQSDRTPRQHRGAQNMVSAIKRTCGIAALGLLTLASTRSEEHTSELQSLMRISYAVFCLKKKKKRHQQNTLQ